MKDDRVEGHLQATLEMLKERHGESFSFTLVARDATPIDDLDGKVYVISDETDATLVVGMLNKMLHHGLLPGTERD